MRPQNKALFDGEDKVDLISALQTFLKVVDTGSFSGAADDRQLTQPAVSRQISALEKHFNTRLLHRTTSGVSLTAEGERVVPMAIRILEAVDEIGDTVGCDGTHASGKVRLAVPAPLGLYLSDRLGELLQEHPNLSVELIFKEEASDLIGEGLDLEVRLGPPADSTLICRRIGWTTAFLVAAPSYLAKRTAPQKPEDVTAHDCICYTRVGDGRTWYFSGGSEELPVKINARFLANSGLAVHRAALAGAGLAILSHIVATQDIADGKLVNLMPAFPPARFPIYVVYPSRRNIPQRVRTVLEFLISAVQADPAMSGAGMGEP
jgi:DNA-binding transcriptional LysR family regulator